MMRRKKIELHTFDAFFKLYHPKVKNFIYGFLKDEDEACDMAQDIFYKIWINWDSLSKQQFLQAYLFRMARNMIYDYFEHSLVANKYESSIDTKSLYEDLIEENLYAKELEMLIDISIEQMPEQRQRIFKMSRKDGYTNQEISEITGISKRTVENHLTRALSDLRKVIANTFLFFL